MTPLKAVSYGYTSLCFVCRTHETYELSVCSCALPLTCFCIHTLPFNLSILYAKLKHTASSVYGASITKCGVLCLQFLNPPDYSSFSFKLDDFTGAKLSPDADRTKTLRANAKSFNDIWRTGDAEVADKVLDKDVKDVNMMFGGEKDGVDSFKSMITGVFKVDIMPLFAPTCVLSCPTISKACPNCNLETLLCQGQSAPLAGSEHGYAHKSFWTAPFTGIVFILLDIRLCIWVRYCSTSCWKNQL